MKADNRLHFGVSILETSLPWPAGEPLTAA